MTLSSPAINWFRSRRALARSNSCRAIVIAFAVTGWMMLFKNFETPACDVLTFKLTNPATHPSLGHSSRGKVGSLLHHTTTRNRGICKQDMCDQCFYIKQRNNYLYSAVLTRCNGWKSGGGAWRGGVYFAPQKWRALTSTVETLNHLDKRILLLRIFHLLDIRLT